MQADFSDVIYASRPSGNHIQGLGGNDALGGSAGADKIEGGEGDDLLVGGGGADELLGGAGDDIIWANTSLAASTRERPGELWEPPAGKEVVLVRPTWGIYLDKEADGGTITVSTALSGQIFASEGVRIDGGAGDDRIFASWSDDRIQGGEGKDAIMGLAGNDIIEGGDGNDRLIQRSITINSIACRAHCIWARGSKHTKNTHPRASKTRKLSIKSGSRAYGDCAGCYEKRSETNSHAVHTSTQVRAGGAA
jgi:Ca2+-binding RTX toxin-like protein